MGGFLHAVDTRQRMCVYSGVRGTPTGAATRQEQNMIVQELGSPLVVIDQTVLCDRYPQHETRIITSGPQAYAASLTGVTASTASRFSTVIQVVCQVTDREGEECGGIAEVDLAAPGAWEASGDAIALLNRYGTAVEA